MKKPKKRKKLYWLTFAVLIIALAVGGFLLYRSDIITKTFRNKDIIARVGSNNITKQEVQKVRDDMLRAGFYIESEDKIRDLIMNYWLLILASREYQLDISDKEVLSYLQSSLSGSPQKINFDINNSYIKYKGYFDLLQNRLTNIVSNYGSGAYVIAHFDQNMVRNTTQLKSLSDEQYKQLLDDDRKYATDFINKTFNELKTGKITFEQAMQIQIDDPKIGKKALNTAPQSSKFGSMSELGPGMKTSNFDSDPQFRQKIDNLKPGEFSEPFMMQVMLGANENSPKADGIWIIAKIDSINSKGPKFDTLNAAIQFFKQKYGYEVYN